MPSGASPKSWITREQSSGPSTSVAGDGVGARTSVTARAASDRVLKRFISGLLLLGGAREGGASVVRAGTGMSRTVATARGGGCVVEHRIQAETAHTRRRPVGARDTLRSRARKGQGIVGSSRPRRVPMGAKDRASRHPTPYKSNHVRSGPEVRRHLGGWPGAPAGGGQTGGRGARRRARPGGGGVGHGADHRRAAAPRAAGRGRPQPP